MSESYLSLEMRIILPRTKDSTKAPVSLVAQSKAFSKDELINLPTSTQVKARMMLTALMSEASLALQETPVPDIPLDQEMPADMIKDLIKFVHLHPERTNIKSWQRADKHIIQVEIQQLTK